MGKANIGKSLVVIDGDLRLLIERGKKMYVVSSLDIRGLNTQGKTIEEAIENAHDAAKLLAEDRNAMTREIRNASRKAKKAHAVHSAQPKRKPLSRSKTTGKI